MIAGKYKRTNPSAKKVKAGGADIDVVVLASRLHQQVQYPSRRHFDAEQALVSPQAGDDDCIVSRRDFSVLLHKDLDCDSVDLVLTDPPYTISRKTGFASGGKKSVQRFRVSMEFGRWDTRQIDLDKLATGMMRVLRTGGTAIVWYDLWKLSHLSEAMVRAGFRMLRAVIWEKTNPVPLNMRASYLSNSREIAVSAVKGGKPTFHSKYDCGIYRKPIPRHHGARIHPTQKPLDLFCELVEKHSNPGDLVVDPFLGSGTAAIASLKTYRRFIGCDISPTYTKLARQRIANFRCAKRKRSIDIRFDATKLGLKLGQAHGDMIYGGSSVGCYWYDPSAFTAILSANAKKSH